MQDDKQFPSFQVPLTQNQAHKELLIRQDHLAGVTGGSRVIMPRAFKDLALLAATIQPNYSRAMNMPIGVSVLSSWELFIYHLTFVPISVRIPDSVPTSLV